MDCPVLCFFEFSWVSLFFFYPPPPPPPPQCFPLLWLLIRWLSKTCPLFPHKNSMFLGVHLPWFRFPRPPLFVVSLTAAVHPFYLPLRGPHPPSVPLLVSCYEVGTVRSFVLHFLPRDRSFGTLPKISLVLVLLSSVFLPCGVSGRVPLQCDMALPRKTPLLYSFRTSSFLCCPRTLARAGPSCEPSAPGP